MWSKQRANPSIPKLVTKKKMFLLGMVSYCRQGIPNDSEPTTLSALVHGKIDEWMNDQKKTALSSEADLLLNISKGHWLNLLHQAFQTMICPVCNLLIRENILQHLHCIRSADYFSKPTWALWPSLELNPVTRFGLGLSVSHVCYVLSSHFMLNWLIKEITWATGFVHRS